MKPLAVAAISVFVVSVRKVFAWLMMLGVIAGLSGRVMSLDHVHVEKHETESCGHDHHHHHPEDRDGGDHSPDCPPGPHGDHSHACCQTSPLPPVPEGSPRFIAAPNGSLLAVNWVTALPPDEPVFALDKPPLI